MVTMSVMEGLVKLRGGKLSFYMFSTELPPVLEVGGKRAYEIMKILREKMGSYLADGAEIVRLNPFRVSPVLVWIVASVATRPSPDLLEALLAKTPRSAVDLIFEVEEARRSYVDGGPMIRYGKLRKVASIIVDILRLEGYPV